MVVVVVILIVLAMVALLVVSTTVLFLVLMVVVAVVVLVALAVVVSVVVAVVVVLVEGLTAVSTLALVLVVLVIFVIDEDLVSDSMNSVLMVGISNVPSAVEDFVVVFSFWCEDLTTGVVVVDISGVANVAVRLLNCVGSIADAEFSSNSITDSLFVVFCNGVVGSCNGSLIVVVSSVVDAFSDIAVVGNIVVPSNVDEALISSVVSLQMW